MNKNLVLLTFIVLSLVVVSYGQFCSHECLQKFQCPDCNGNLRDCAYKCPIDSQSNDCIRACMTDFEGCLNCSLDMAECIGTNCGLS